MKELFMSLVVLLLVVSCKSTEAVVTENKDLIEEVSEDGAVSGIVYVSLKGCPVLIIVDSGGTDQKRLYPVNLPQEFKVDGTKISFNYVPSRAMQPESCTLIDMVVSVENVQKTR